MGWLMLVGYTLEAIGLALAGWGLRGTWKANAEGRSFLAGLPRWMRFWQARQPPAQGRTVGAHVTSGWAGGYTPTPFSGGTPEERLSAMEAAFHGLERRVHDNRAGLDIETTALRRDIQALYARTAATANRAEAYARELVVDGVPLAVVGLGFALLGLALQGLATWLTWA